MSHKYFRPFFILILIIGLMAVQAPQPARAAGPWYVTPTGNDNENCLSPSTACATINGAIGKATAGDTINVAVGTYTGSDTEVVLIDKDITLSGGWDLTYSTHIGTSTIDGQSSRRGITVNSGVTALADYFIVQNGTAISGGGINNLGNLKLSASVVSNNMTTNNTYGGGIYNAGILTVNNSTIKDNIGDYLGGGIYNSGDLVLTNSAVSNNSISYYTGEGGGIKNGGTLLLSNSTVSGNTASGGRGGGISNDGTSSIKNSTITGNNTTEGGGISNLYGLSLVLSNSIVAGNAAVNGPDCYDNFDFPDMITSLGSNLIGDTSLCTYTPGSGDLTNVDPVVGPLQDNGGLTFTHALLPGSPAIDAGNPAGCTDQDGNLLTTDQRGVARPQGAACDIGAFEFETGGGGGETIQVTIDIMPGNKHNKINPKSKERIQVAILSTPDFDAFAMVDKSTLTFGRTGEEDSLASCKKKPKDVNRDKLPDLVCDFYIRASGFQPGDTIGILKGMTLEGNAFTGQDAVKIQKVHQRPDDDDD